MSFYNRLLSHLPATTVHAHCDLPCGIYDPAQARIEAASVYAITKKALESKDDDFIGRATVIKEERAELVKHHLWVLWTDYFKPEHLEAHPELHDTFWRATKAAGEAKHHADLEHTKALLDVIDEVGRLFASTKPGYNYDAVVSNTNAQVGL